MHTRSCRGSCRSRAARADADYALQGLMQIKRCKGSWYGADADQALQDLMQIRRCRC